MVFLSFFFMSGQESGHYSKSGGSIFIIIFFFFSILLFFFYPCFHFFKGIFSFPEEGSIDGLSTSYDDDEGERDDQSSENKNKNKNSVSYSYSMQKLRNFTLRYILLAKDTLQSITKKSFYLFSQVAIHMSQDDVITADGKLFSRNKARFLRRLLQIASEKRETWWYVKKVLDDDTSNEALRQGAPRDEVQFYESIVKGNKQQCCRSPETDIKTHHRSSDDSSEEEYKKRVEKCLRKDKPLPQSTPPTRTAQQPFKPRRRPMTATPTRSNHKYTYSISPLLSSYEADCDIEPTDLRNKGISYQTSWKTSPHPERKVRPHSATLRGSTTYMMGDRRMHPRPNSVMQKRNYEHSNCSRPASVTSNLQTDVPPTGRHISSDRDREQYLYSKFKSDFQSETDSLNQLLDRATPELQVAAGYQSLETANADSLLATAGNCWNKTGGHIKRVKEMLDLADKHINGTVSHSNQVTPSVSESATTSDSSDSASDIISPLGGTGVSVKKKNKKLPQNSVACELTPETPLVLTVKPQKLIENSNTASGCSPEPEESSLQLTRQQTLNGGANQFSDSVGQCGQRARRWRPCFDIITSIEKTISKLESQDQFIALADHTDHPPAINERDKGSVLSEGLGSEQVCYYKVYLFILEKGG